MIVAMIRRQVQLLIQPKIRGLCSHVTALLNKKATKKRQRWFLGLQKLFGSHEPSSVQLWVSYNRQPMKAAQFMTRHPITVSRSRGRGLSPGQQSAM